MGGVWLGLGLFGVGFGSVWGCLGLGSVWVGDCFALAFARTYLRGHLAVTNATRPRKDWLAGASSGQSDDSPSFSVWETELPEEPNEEEPEEVLAEGM